MNPTGTADSAHVISVVIDPRVFVVSMREPTGRSGIFRVTFELVKYLLNDSRVRVLFNCRNVGEYLSLARFSWLERRHGFASVRFPRWVRPASVVAGEIEEYVRRVNRPASDTAPRPVKRWRRYLDARYLLCRTAYALLGLPCSRTGSGTATGRQVFHSTCFPLPEPSGSVPRFLTVHDLLPLTAPDWFPADQGPGLDVRRALESVRERDWVFADSQATRKELLEHCPQIDPGRVVVNHPAAGSEFHPVEDQARIREVLGKSNIPVSEPYFLSVGTLEVRKNTVTLVKAFQMVLQASPATRVRLVLCGARGWLNDPLFEVISADPLLSSRVIFTGYVPDEDLPALYSGALCFVYVSLGEGFGLPIVEAMQCGAPVIISGVSSLPEVAGEAAIQVDPRDPRTLADAMSRVSESKELRDRLSKSSRQRASLFSWQAFGDKTVRTYLEALQSWGSSR